MEAKQILLDELKKEGLDLADDALIQAVKAVFKALPKFLLATENKVDDLLIAVLPAIEKVVVEKIDKLDGEIEVK